ncbi:Alw26I/Eco31I/Esp3I family type II restriction endonuclease [Candidatus Latescibacteria bacterium]|nr:Alw26I/Eco31I/Esp3I family type II restriction endonuclease [Candidatus Latescibacterota bacterium]
MAKSYGSRGQTWHPDFISYMELIANHEVYKGMPDVFTDDGRIQWEAPSNRSSGRFKDTHHKRRDWWRNKAREVGIDTTRDKWISQTAKRIHPTGSKPCKRCGQLMEIRYAYVGKLLVKRLDKLDYIDNVLGDRNDPYEHILDLVNRLFEQFGDTFLQDLPQLLKTKNIIPPEMGTNIDDWIEWIGSQYIPSEPSLLSPGAMSNAPDRFDGFHSFNLCHRSKADTGRHEANLKSYTTDRRVFEYWTSGDWIAADRLMGQIRSVLSSESCANGHPGPCTADHIGPISLGFTHRPEFQLLCRECNSAKNNRMTLRDVSHLKDVELLGEKISSWHSKALWDLRKNDVVNDETALRLSKLLRDNRHSLMSILNKVAERGYYTFLATFLELSWAEYNLTFENLRSEDHITKYDSIQRIKRESKYATEQKARRCRIAFESLIEYFSKQNRNAFIIATSQIDDHVKIAISELGLSSKSIKDIDHELSSVLAMPSTDRKDLLFRGVVGKLPSKNPDNFEKANKHLEKAMALIARELSRMWNDERYVRFEYGWAD